MSENFGYNDALLRVNLNTKSTEIQPIGKDVLRKYVGGTSLALWYLLNEIPQKIDPLSSANKVFITTSPLTGIRFSGNARHTVATVSPLTGGLAASEAGGWWGPALKLAGLDAIAIEGVASDPLYLYIEDGVSELRDASDLWGKDTGEVELALKDRHGKSARILQTGPAGENLVRYACLTNELRHFNGRGGTGAVFGHKKLRAVVVINRRKRLPVADEAGLKDLAVFVNSDIRKHPALGPHHELGTTRFLMPTNAGGMLPTRNFRDGSFEDAEMVSGEEIDSEFSDGSHTCFACTVACKRKMKKNGDALVDTSLYGGPEYESMGMLGPLLGINTASDVVALNALCNAKGLDSISLGATIAWYIEAVETVDDRSVFGDGKTLGWNEPKKVQEIILDIVSGEGIGALLALGSKKAAEKVGGDTFKFAMQVKGQEFPAHEPRGKWNVGLGMAVNPAGADHLVVAHDVVIDHPGDPTAQFSGADLSDLEPIGLTDPLGSESLAPGKIRNFVYLQQLWMLHDILSVCKFMFVPETRTYNLRHVVELVEKATGWNTSLFDLMKVAERTITMARLFNIRMGFTADDDTLPPRMFEPLRNGALEGHSIDPVQFREALELYYEMMGWNTAGVPSRGKLVELGIAEFA